MDIELPELAEGVTAATVVRICVQVGEKVSSGQTLIEVETDKSTMPVPAPEEGIVGEICVKTGQKILLGTIIVRYQTSGSASASSSGSAPIQPSNNHSMPAPVPNNVAVNTPAPTTVETSALQDILLPELGEGINSGTVVSIAVQVGTEVTVDQEFLSLETDKAAMPVPCSVAGKVESINVQVGQKILIGSIIGKIRVSSSTSANKTSTISSPSNPTSIQPAAVLPNSSTADRSADSDPSLANTRLPELARTSNTLSNTAINVSAPNSAKSRAKDSAANILVPAGPATRRYAREMGVDLADVMGSARGGRVTVDDVKNYIRNRMTSPATPASPSSTTSSTFSTTTSTPVPSLPDFSKWGPVEIKEASNLRQAVARNLTLAWTVAPMVTQFDQADITELEAGRKRIAEGLPKGSPKITMTVLAIKAVVAALKDFPNFNTAYDAANGKVIYKQYYHIGIAVDTERGLVVPVVRDADKKSIRELAKSITDFAEKARQGKLTIDEMRGGTFTITNLGGIGGTAFTPIINYPEVAILGLSRSSFQPAIREGKVEPRLMLPISLTYDHRIIDGADGARFTNRLVQLFSDPLRLLMES